MPSHRRLALAATAGVLLCFAVATLRRLDGPTLIISNARKQLQTHAGGWAYAPRWSTQLEAVSLRGNALELRRQVEWRTPEGASQRAVVELLLGLPSETPLWLDRNLGFAASFDAFAAELLRTVSSGQGSASAAEEALRATLEAQGFQVDSLNIELDRGGLPPPAVIPSLAERPRQPPVLLLGLDGLDPTLVEPMIARGELPTLARLLDPAQAAVGVLDPPEPLLSPLLWTTMATGVGPERHGILDFLQPVDPPAASAADASRTGAKAPRLTPVMSTTRKVPALWNLLSAAGRRSVVIGWWATFPAEAVRGVVISDRASAQLFIGGRESLRGEGLIYPPGRAAELERQLVLDQAVTDDEVARYVQLPLAEIASRRAADASLDPVVQLVRLLASTKSYLGMAQHLWQTDRPDLLLLYVEGTDTVGHLFAPYHPPRSSWIDAGDFARYQQAVATYYRSLDAWLAPLVAAGEAVGANSVVVSDHGFAWGDDRPRADSGTRTATAALWHRDRAVFALRGPAARAGARGSGDLVDLTPTLMALLGLPRGAEMTGRPLAWALTSTPSEETFAYHARLDAVGPTPTGGATVNAASAELIAKLQALGYVGGAETASTAAGADPLAASGPGADASVVAGDGTTTRNAQLNLGTVLLGNGDAAGALAAYQRAVDADPGDPAARVKVGLALQELGQLAAAIGSYRAALERTRRGAQVEAAWLGIGLCEEGLGKTSAARDAFRAGVIAQPESFALWSNLARLEHAGGDEAAALAALESARSNAPGDLPTLNLAAALYAKQGRLEQARKLWNESLDRQPDQPKVREMLAMIERPGG